MCEIESNRNPENDYISGWFEHISEFLIDFVNIYCFVWHGIMELKWGVFVLDLLKQPHRSGTA